MFKGMDTDSIQYWPEIYTYIHVVSPKKGLFGAAPLLLAPWSFYLSSSSGVPFFGVSRELLHVYICGNHRKKGGARIRIWKLPAPMSPPHPKAKNERFRLVYKVF